jgi:hypothetical protein
MPYSPRGHPTMSLPSMRRRPARGRRQSIGHTREMARRFTSRPARVSLRAIALLSMRV